MTRDMIAQQQFEPLARAGNAVGVGEREPRICRDRVALHPDGVGEHRGELELRTSIARSRRGRPRLPCGGVVAPLQRGGAGFEVAADGRARVQRKRGRPDKQPARRPQEGARRAKPLHG